MKFGHHRSSMPRPWACPGPCMLWRLGCFDKHQLQLCLVACSVYVFHRPWYHITGSIYIYHIIYVIYIYIYHIYIYYPIDIYVYITSAASLRLAAGLWSAPRGICCGFHEGATWQILERTIFMVSICQSEYKPLDSGGGCCMFLEKRKLHLVRKTLQARQTCDGPPSRKGRYRCFAHKATLKRMLQILGSIVDSCATFWSTSKPSGNSQVELLSAVSIFETFPLRSESHRSVSVYTSQTMLTPYGLLSKQKSLGSKSDGWPEDVLWHSAMNIPVISWLFLQGGERSIAQLLRAMAYWATSTGAGEAMPRRLRPWMAGSVARVHRHDSHDPKIGVPSRDVHGDDERHTYGHEVFPIIYVWYMHVYISIIYHTT